MLDIKPFNQRDPRWANDQHGTSNSTIGKTGCTICVVASMLVHAGYDIDPKRLNKLLTDNSGYSNGNLIIWTVIQHLFPKVKWNYRHYKYDNALASEWIKVRGIMPIIEVGAAPIGGAPGGKHWVGFVGDMKSVDPWTGTIKDTSTWEPVGMALYEYTPGSAKEDNMSNMYGTPNQYDLSNPESMKVAVDRLNDILTGKYVKKEDSEAAVRKVATELTEQLNKEKEYSQKVTLNLVAVAMELGLPKEAKAEEIMKAIKDLKNQPIPAPEQPSTPEDGVPETKVVNGRPWALNGLTIDSEGKMVGNYKRND